MIILFGDKKMNSPMVPDLVYAMMMDLSLRPAMIVDFGLNNNGSVKHSALQKAVRAGATEAELNEALGNGKKIEALVKKYTEIEGLDFDTPYDMFLREATKTVEKLEAKDVLSEDERQELNNAYEVLKT
jgi:hypothetical protein